MKGIDITSLEAYRERIKLEWDIDIRVLGPVIGTESWYDFKVTGLPVRSSVLETWSSYELALGEAIARVETYVTEQRRKHNGDDI